MKKLIEENITSLLKVRKALIIESDRGCALMMMSFLDAELEKLLRSKFVGTTKQLDELFNFNGSVGTLSSRIKISYALGLISDAVTQDLDILRKIRNDFGHDFSEIDFNTESISSRIKNLKTYIKYFGEESNREIYISSATGILGEIQAEIMTAEKFIKKNATSRELSESIAQEFQNQVGDFAGKIAEENPNFSQEELNTLILEEAMKFLEKKILKK